MTITHPLIETCRGIRFGDIAGDDTAPFYGQINGEIPELCRSLPGPMQAEAMLFFMAYAGIRMGEPLDFFRNYYRPAWSILHRLASMAGGPVPGLDAAVTAHAMAMTLHSLDDHLVDGEVPVSHLALLLRGQMWRRMMAGIDSFADGIPGGTERARGLIDDYYGGISSAFVPGTLDEYCALFRRQMASSLVVPLLLSMRVSDDPALAADVRAAYESFGIAWRLLDDIQDLGEDIDRGARSAVHICLGPEGRGLWEGMAPEEGREGSDRLCAIIEEGGVIGTLARRIVAELGSAAKLMEKRGMGAMAGEFRALAGPVAEGAGRLR